MSTPISEECREIIRLGELATEGPWEPEDLGEGWDITRNGEGIAYDVLPDNARFIAQSRTFSPAAARALLEEIEWLECQDQVSGLSTIFRNRLETIRANWSRETK